MSRREYEKHLKSYEEKNSQKLTKLCESSSSTPHKMFVKGATKKAFKETFEAIKDEFFPFEKVDLIDYGKFVDGLSNKTR